MPPTRVLHRSIGQSYPVAAGGDGIRIRDTAGKEYIDASGGAAVSCLGHSHPDVLAAMHAQLDKLAYAHTGFFTSEAAEVLGKDLVAHAPAGISHAYFVSGLPMRQPRRRRIAANTTDRCVACNLSKRW